VPSAVWRSARSSPLVRDRDVPGSQQRTTELAAGSAQNSGPAPGQFFFFLGEVCGLALWATLPCAMCAGVCGCTSRVWKKLTAQKCGGIVEHHFFETTKRTDIRCAPSSFHMFITAGGSSLRGRAFSELVSMRRGSRPRTLSGWLALRLCPFSHL
jgi:hypothetical protein